MSGLFVTIEGIDGSGKTTMLRALADRLSAGGADVIRTREPGGSPGAEAIRALLLDQGNDWSPEVELILFNAARRDHCEKTVMPALRRGAIVLCDRFIDSTRAYQGVRNPHLRQTIENMHADLLSDATGAPLMPDITFLLDIDARAAAERSAAGKEGEQRFEQMGLSFQRDVRTSLLEVARRDPQRVRVLDAACPVETLAMYAATMIDSLQACNVDDCSL